MNLDTRDAKQTKNNKEDGPFGCCRVDTDHMFGLVGIMATFLNLLVVAFIYLYTND